MALFDVVHLAAVSPDDSAVGAATVSGVPEWSSYVKQKRTVGGRGRHRRT
jgi:hypothetical protein